MNIKVNYPRTIHDGAELVFRSPVDCSQVTGLIVHYPVGDEDASQEFAFADAHGNNVGDIDHLFAENVVVKVILDVTSGMAFVQNADTNTYLEARFTQLERSIGSGGGGGSGSGENGATFTPSVSADGVISWSNDKGLTNPEPVNIKGPKGDDGSQGIQGEQGIPGPKGDPGDTPKRGTDYWTAADIAEIKSYVEDAILGGEW